MGATCSLLVWSVRGWPCCAAICGRGGAVAAGPAAAVVRPAEDQGIIDKVDATFRAQWAGQKLKPSRLRRSWPLRRLAWGDGDRAVVAGDSPARSNPGRLAWSSGWTVLRKRRHADYLAERFARAYVGTEDGPFISLPPPPLRGLAQRRDARRTGLMTRSSAT